MLSHIAKAGVELWQKIGSIDDEIASPDVHVQICVHEVSKACCVRCAVRCAVRCVCGCAGAGLHAFGERGVGEQRELWYPYRRRNPNVEVRLNQPKSIFLKSFHSFLSG